MIVDVLLMGLEGNIVILYVYEGVVFYYILLLKEKRKDNFFVIEFIVN